MAIAVDPNRTFDYILKEDRDLPAEQQTVFKLKVLSARELARLEDSVSVMDKDGNWQVKVGTKALEILSCGIKGWENLRNRAGIFIPFSGIMDNNFDLLRPEWRRELADAITEQANLSEDERKNSE